ncbi:MAG: hypothetical protein KIT09_23120 [Bryobacteraceae bacterium]|nr:hypothetical protein [Bryobacteraceae bacterium]
MLRAIIVGADLETKEKLENAFQATARLALMRWVAHYPEKNDLSRILRAHAPQVVFTGVDDLEKALALARAIEATIPGVPVVAVGRYLNLNSAVLLELMKAGIREFVPIPFENALLQSLAERVKEHLAKTQLSFDSTDLMFSFLPAKPGVGASTLALNLSVAFAAQPKTNVLLTDFDLNSGLVAFMLKLTSAYSVVDAVEMADNLDESLWPQLVNDLGALHILPAGRPTPGVRIQPVQIERLLTFARRLYTVICADLSGNLEKYSIELMHESKRIFIVTTPEIPPLHLARDRINFLRQMDLGDRISILLNRFHKQSAIPVAQIEDILETPVYEVFPNAYSSVHKSLVEARPIDVGSELGARLYATARRILAPDSTPRPLKKRFLQGFSIMPGRNSSRR